MKVFDFPQRSEPWFALRRSCFTGSEIGPFLFNEDKKALTARQSLIDEKIGGMADGEDCPPNFEDFWMKRGTKLEPMAVAAYEEFTGDVVRQVGFVMHDCGAFGVSPDGLMTNRECGLEQKCPSGKIQARRLRENILPPEYLCQCHLGMAATGFDEWSFWSWHPNMPPLHIAIRRDDFTERLHDAVMDLHDEMQRQIADMAARWEEHKARTLTAAPER